MADKQVNRENINASLDKLGPTAEQSERMWGRLSAAMEERDKSGQKAEEKNIHIEQARKNRSKKKGVAYRMMQVAAVIAVVLGLGVAVNGMTGGQV